MPAILPPHVRTDSQGVAWVDDTNVKVIEVVLARLAHGWSPEEIHFQHPHLSLAQIHAALAYYYDNQETMDQTIERELRETDGQAAAATQSPLRRRLRAAGRLP
jgi:uncharacterized protein (DUF433 family)